MFSAGRSRKQPFARVKSTTLSVGDIILMVGYENTSYFYRIFTEKYGMSPKSYRRAEKAI